jgi:hypothetical protein
MELVRSLSQIDTGNEYTVYCVNRSACDRLGPGLSCCLQDRAPSGLERAAFGDSARQRPDVDYHATSSPGSMVVISADSRGTRPGTPGLQHLPAVIPVAAAELASEAAAQRLPGPYMPSRYFDGWKIRSPVRPVDQSRHPAEADRRAGDSETGYSAGTASWPMPVSVQPQNTAEMLSLLFRQIEHSQY